MAVDVSCYLYKYMFPYARRLVEGDEGAEEKVVEKIIERFAPLVSSTTHLVFVADGGPSPLKNAQQDRERSRDKALVEYHAAVAATKTAHNRLNAMASACLRPTTRMVTLLLDRAERAGMTMQVAIREADHQLASCRHELQNSRNQLVLRSPFYTSSDRYRACFTGETDLARG